jgi:hypothetical protein
MKVLKTLRPGAPGAKRLLDRFGKSLVCVRYRHDPSSDVRVTTVELILESTRVQRRRSADRSRDLPEPVVGVKVHYRETDLRTRIKQAGGRWRPDVGVWELALSAARRLGLVNRIVRRRATEHDGAVTSDHADVDG